MSWFDRNRRAPTANPSQGVALSLFALALASCANAGDLEDQVFARCGLPGYRADSGCKIELPRGTIAVKDTIHLGGCTTDTVRNSVTIEGQSAGVMISQPGRAPTAGTTLQWKGKKGGVMLDVCGASF